MGPVDADTVINLIRKASKPCLKRWWGHGQGWGTVLGPGWAGPGARVGPGDADTAPRVIKEVAE